jgi:hypothetical protein
MVTLSHSDARAIFLGIAQLIPVFLIALFVMDNAWISKSVEQARSSVATALDGAAKVLKEHESEVERAVENQLKNIGELVATYNTPEAHSEAVQMRAKVYDFADDSRKRGKDMLDTLSRRLADIVQREEIAVRKRTSTYAKAAIVTIMPGMAGEVASLWGAVGLASSSVIIAFATAVSVGIAGTLSVLAISRLIAEPPSGLLATLRKAWIALLCGATLTTFFWIVLSVQVKH